MPWNIQRAYLPTIWMSCSSSASNAAARHLDPGQCGLPFSTARRCKARGTVRRISLLASDQKSGPSNPPSFGNFGDGQDFHQGRAAEDIVPLPQVILKRTGKDFDRERKLRTSARKLLPAPDFESASSAT